MLCSDAVREIAKESHYSGDVRERRDGLVNVRESSRGNRNDTPPKTGETPRE